MRRKAVLQFTNFYNYVFDNIEYIGNLATYSRVKSNISFRVRICIRRALPNSKQKDCVSCRNFVNFFK